MAMAATGMVTAAIWSAAAAMGKAKAATGAVPTGTIATGMAADLVPIKGSRDMAATCNHLQNAAGGLGSHTDSTIRRRGPKLGCFGEVC